MANIRKGPGITYEVISQSTQGTHFKKIDQKNDWVKIQADNGNTGWVASWLVNGQNLQADHQYIATTIEETPLFATSNLKTIIGTSEKHSKYQIQETTDEATHILTDSGTEAWIPNSAVEITSGTIAQSPYTADYNTIDNTINKQQAMVMMPFEGSNIRNAPNLESTKIASSQAGAVYPFISQENNFYQIKNNDGTSGYISQMQSILQNPMLKQEAEVYSETSNLNDQIIVIDPGHGGSDPGALGGNFNEKDIALKTGLELKKLLEDYGVNVVMTREDDRDVSLEERVAITEQANANFFISLHYDAYGQQGHQEEASGTSTYYYHEQYQPLAMTINKYIQGTVPLPNRGINFGNFQVIRETNKPGLLIELGYMDNPFDYQQFSHEDYPRIASQAIYYGLLEYFQPNE